MAITTATIFTLFVLVFPVIRCARILVYVATPSISHQVVFRPLTQALAARGHEVIVVTPNPAFSKDNAPANLTEIDVHDVSYQNWEEIFIYHRGVKEDFVEEVILMFKKFALIFDAQLATPGVQEILSKDKSYFDIMLLESCNRPLLGLVQKFDAPVILISSLGAVPAQYSALGAPVHPLLYPSPGRQKLYNLSLFEKGVEIFNNVVLDYLISSAEDFDLSIIRKNFGDNVPGFEILAKKIVMMFLNEHPIWADNRPVPPNIIYIGGIHQPPEKDLPKDLDNYLNSSKHGVIYVSFGTNVLPSQLPAEKIEIMTKVFSQVPYDILWKYDKDILPGQSKNIKLSNWLPQSDLLKHPKVKLFITQGGLQSTDEAINAAVPVIGIPMSGDQWYNIQKYVHHGIGLQLDMVTLTEKDFNETVNRVILDKSFKNNMLRLRIIMRERPIKPLDHAVWWTEHIIKYGGSHLRAPAANMSWLEYYEVKLVFIVMSILIIIIGVLFWIVKSVFKFIFNFYKINIKLKEH
ncbi:UDP-glycosyltransferase UGT5-like [Maniola hyperantus]|uniref:UDP-glycosyltransferase UGT5-like n=1 Tax=Aphantopus hyperantus TaxID=2795564 RepID=UPI003749071B